MLNKKLSKIFALAAFGIWATSSLVACSSDDSPTTSNNEATPPAKEKVLKEYSNTLLNVSNGQTTIDEDFWKSALSKVWTGIKERNIAPYGTGFIHRPKSEKPGDAVSEGVGYGMLVALYANDQATFNSIWEAANNHMWNSCYYNWQVDVTGKTIGKGAATDAEEDVALALIFADKLVQAGKWTAYESPVQGGYLQHAQKMLGCMWSTKQIVSGGYVAPGAGWGGSGFLNPGYFSPASYRIFAMVDPNHDWASVISMCYNILAASPGFSYGMVMDWMTPTGGQVSSSNLGYNAYGGGTYFFKDAIRILWRVAMDAIWFNDENAKFFLNNAMLFINSVGGAAASNFYQMNGQLVPEEDIWNDMAAGTIPRFRREHSHLTIGMWATAAAAIGTDEDKAAFSQELAKFYEDGSYFGNAVDPLGGIEDTLHNEMYFDQFLAWFGAATLSGSFTNVLSGIDTPAENRKIYSDISYELPE